MNRISKLAALPHLKLESAAADSGSALMTTPREARSIMPNIQIHDQPVTQITIVESEPGKQAEALSLMGERARFMARQPGFVSISLHRSLDGRRIINYVQWKDRDALESAHKSPAFRKEWGRFDALTDSIDPHLYEVAQIWDGGGTNKV